MNLFLAFSALLFSLVTAQIARTIPNTITTGPVDVRFNSGYSLFDGQQITSRPNATTYEWWYFDVVSTTSKNESIVVVFFEATSTAFSVQNNTALQVQLWMSYENGTWFAVPIIPAQGEEGAAVITEMATDVAGVWKTTGFEFASAEQMKKYVVTIDNTALGIKGTIEMDRVAPPHYPCGPAEHCSNQMVTPHVGWNNAIPDSDATVNLTVNGTQISYQGFGYHDKNWGDRPFFNVVDTWYWGHARFGPYSIVWFDVLNPNGTEYVSSYVSKNGTVIAASCTGGAIKVRPAGRNSEYPPTIRTGFVEMYNISLDLGPEEGGPLEVMVHNDLVIGNSPFYVRYAVSVEAKRGRERFEGKGVSEEFRYRGSRFLPEL